MNDKQAKVKIESWRWRIAKAGMTQGEFALKAGVQRSHLSRYINFRKNPSAITFTRIETLLKELKV
jgi:transcriptional regulator with XRE-family HTH domain